EAPELFDRLEIIFAGEKPVWFDPMVKDADLKNVTHLGFISKTEVKKLIASADYLLITSSKILNGNEYSVAGKTFEYLASGKPIVGVVCDGEQRDVLEKTGNAIILNPDLP